MKTYLETLKERAEAQQVSLLESFKRADIPTSTYYRAINGTNELRYDTAIKVIRSIENFYPLQQTSDDTRALRQSDRSNDSCEK
jgi:predicted transcriptional regulator